MTRLIFVEIFKLRRRVLAKVLAVIIVLLAIIVQFGRWQGTEADYYGGSDAGGRREIVLDENGRIVEIVEPEKPDFAESGAQDQEALDAGRRERFLERTVSENLDYIRWLGLVLGVMLVAGGIGSEYSYGTLRPYLTCAESREKYLGAKFVALGALIAAGLALSLALGIGLSLLIAWANGGADLGFVDGPYLRDVVFDFVKTLYVLVPYLLIAGLAAVVGRSAMVGAVVGLILFSIESGVSSWFRLLDSWARHIPDYLLLWNAEAVLGSEGEIIDDRIIMPPDPWVGALVLALYSVAAIALSLWVFHRRDVTG